MIIGLTGGMGSGKSTVADIFRKLGVPVLDADEIAHRLVDSGTPACQAIIAHFGPSILKNDHALNRKKLQSIIFNSASEKQWLEDLLHPLVKENIKKEIEKLLQAKIANDQYIIAVVPLLFESNFQKEVDRVLLIDCPEELQIERAVLRTEMTPEEVQNILNQQMPRKNRIEQSQDVLMNDGSMEELKLKVEKLHHFYKKLNDQL